MASPSILRIERINYALGGVLVILATLTQDRAIALGVAVGVALTCLNFNVLRRLVTKWTSDAQKGQDRGRQHQRQDQQDDGAAELPQHDKQG